jgi:hypothetical protein
MADDATRARDFTPAERTVLAELLRLASDQFGNHGCNDHPLPDTPENREIVRACREHQGWDDDEVMAHNGQIIGDDAGLMDYFADRLESARKRASP